MRPPTGPRYGHAVSFREGEPLVFADFTLTLEKEIDPEEGRPMRSTASVTIRRFTVVDRAGAAQTLDVVHGQRTPAPKSFRVGTSGFVLNTFASSAGERLFPDRLEVVRS